MNYDFERELASWLEKREISRKELIAILQQSYYDDFKGLDSITLSRWLTGKVVPPLYKQFLIAKCLEQDLSDIIVTIDENTQKSPFRYSTVLNSVIKAFDFSLTALSYTRLPDKVTSEIRTHTYYEHTINFHDFYVNLSALEGFISELYALKNEVKYKTVLLKNSQGEIIGHWISILNLEKLVSLSSFIPIPENEIKRSCLVKLGYAMNSDHFFELIIQSICYYLLRQCQYKDYAYIFITGYPILEFAKKVFGAKEVKYYPPVNSYQKMGVYLVKVNIVKAISNPILIPKIKKKLKCLQSCDFVDCNLCNLRDFRQ
ncbi:XRE family transcriptional regulator [Vibrio owensii]|uniref:XRE family transcriptional regulator n=1 Tax=Vibrio owensii TaxID=696485 RepID=UPI00215CA48C|nr:XRE family transcriptional regulator [Vibrio owensii]MCR9942185.1 XRE family transcriptional regulator [Vibrio owensii]